MGQEITETRFKHHDFKRFDKMVKQEMELLGQWFREGHFSEKASIAGAELEAWLVDSSFRPAPWNEEVIALTGSPDVVPELSKFNVEFNVDPRPLAGRGLADMAFEMSETWKRCEKAAEHLDTSLVAIGVLPSITDSMLSLKNMSKMHRYKALNEQVLRMREGRPIRVNIDGVESISTEHQDVMLESAATSLQLHLQVPMNVAARYYNAAVILSAFTVAISGNSPFLFGADLWDESRIPLFEQAVDVGENSNPRVALGSGYVKESLEELFLENYSSYPVLLPLALDDASDRLIHVRLHNGTIWRWNRPLIGFDDDGSPHLRIEHRVMSAGPTIADMNANMAFFYGLVESLARSDRPPELDLPFSAAFKNFYEAARCGLDSRVQWIDGCEHSISDLLIEDILPRAAAGLQLLNVDPKLTENWLKIIEARIKSRQTGATWQRKFVERHGRDLTSLISAYHHQQREGLPVHEWTTNKPEKKQPTVKNEPMLQIVEEMPQGLLDAKSNELWDLLGKPTLIHLPGQRPNPLFVSIVLHGNEDVGLHAVQRWFKKQGDRPLPRAMSIFVGNVAAAKVNMRRLPGQSDFNRVWPGTDLEETSEHAMMRQIVADMKSRNVFASIDLHNNTGLNPHYACVTHIEHQHLHLAADFGRTAVFFQHPRGVQTMAFAEICPSVTCECGKVGDELGIEAATNFLDACIHLSEIPAHPLPEGDLHLFHTIATVKVKPEASFGFDETDAWERNDALDMTFRGDLDRLNFQELDSNSWLGWADEASMFPLEVLDQSGNNVTHEFLRPEEGRVQLVKQVVPAMLTRDETVIRQDCVGYFMERYPLPTE